MKETRKLYDQNSCKIVFSVKCKVFGVSEGKKETFTRGPLSTSLAPDWGNLFTLARVIKHKSHKYTNELPFPDCAAHDAASV